MKSSLLKIVFLVGVISLSGMFLMPIWKISLAVPQYPKEIAIEIWINKIENGTDKALQIMNVLNHNIGMMEINPDEIPELTFFPWVLAGIILFGIIAAFPEDKKIRYIWLALLVLALGYALYDFYLWEHEYGHNLSEDAPIKVEQGSFQPPLIGEKEIGNFIVKSYPSSGIVFPLISIIITVVSLVKES